MKLSVASIIKCKPVSCPEPSFPYGKSDTYQSQVFCSRGWSSCEHRAFHIDHGEVFWITEAYQYFLLKIQCNTLTLKPYE